MSNTCETFAARLKRIRRRSYPSAAASAHAFGVHEARWMHWEAGRAKPHLDDFIKLCRFLNTTPNKLLPCAWKKDA